MRVSRRGQITIPKALRERLGMHHNIEVEITLTEQGLLIKKRGAPVHPVDQVYGILGKDASGNQGADDTEHSSRFPWDETEEERAARARRMMEIREQRLRAGLSGIDLVTGILDGLDFDVDEYIEEIRGR